MMHDVVDEITVAMGGFSIAYCWNYYSKQVDVISTLEKCQAVQLELHFLRYLRAERALNHNLHRRIKIKT